MVLGSLLRSPVRSDGTIIIIGPKFVVEEYCLEDILHYVGRDDIRRLGLRGGVELRVWKAITKWRREHRPSVAASHNLSNNKIAKVNSNNNRL